MEMLKTNQKEQITVACYKSWKFQRSVIIHGEWGVLEGGGGGGGGGGIVRKMTSEN